MSQDSNATEDPLSARANSADENAYLEALSRVKAGPVRPGDEIK